MTKTKMLLPILVLFVIGLATEIGCKSQQQRLEPGGAYSGAILTVTNDASGNMVTNAVQVTASDIALYQSDLAMDLAHNTFVTVSDFEERNRQLLWSISHDIKHTLDKARPQVVQIMTAWAKARQAYLANKTPAGLSDLQTLLFQMQNLATAAQAGLAAAGAAPNP